MYFNTISPPSEHMKLFQEIKEKVSKMSKNDIAKMLDVQACDRYNSESGSMTGYNCEKCKNRGDFMKIDDNGNRTIVQCDCVKIRRQYSRIRKSGMQGLIERCTFDNFHADKPYQVGMKETAVKYTESGEKNWLTLCGQSGIGKTHLCSAVCDTLIKQGAEVRYMLWADINAKLDALRYSYAELEAFKETLRDSGTVIYIDDFLKTDINHQSGSFVPPPHREIINAFDVINSRIISGGRTIISTELLMDEIMQMDSALGSRIFQASGAYLYQVARSNDRNYRLTGV